MTTTSGSVPSGTYFIGDPCYAVPDEHWEGLLHATGFFEVETTGTVLGHQVIAFRAYDGPYADETGREYPSDAGLIGITPMALANPTGDPEHQTWLEGAGRNVTFTEPVPVSASDDGSISFGPHRLAPAEDDEGSCWGCAGELSLGLCIAGCDDFDDEDED